MKHLIKLSLILTLIVGCNDGETGSDAEYLYGPEDGCVQDKDLFHGQGWISTGSGYRIQVTNQPAERAGGGFQGSTELYVEKDSETCEYAVLMGGDETIGSLIIQSIVMQTGAACAGFSGTYSYEKTCSGLQICQGSACGNYE